MGDKTEKGKTASAKVYSALILTGLFCNIFKKRSSYTGLYMHQLKYLFMSIDPVQYKVAAIVSIY